MKNIVLSELQKEVVTRQLNGDFSPFLATEDEQKAGSEVIKMAESLLNELDAYDEINGDLLAWFWGKYQSQNEKMR